MKFRGIPFRNLLLLFVLLTHYDSYSQEKNPLINSGEILVEGYKKYSDQNYKDAVAIYQQINKSDTNYSVAILETVNALQSDSQHVEAINLAKMGIKLFPHMFSQFSMQIGNSLDNLKRDEEALLYYDTAMAKNPNDYFYKN